RNARGFGFDPLVVLRNLLGPGIVRPQALEDRGDRESANGELPRAIEEFAPADVAVLVFVKQIEEFLRVIRGFLSFHDAPLRVMTFDSGSETIAGYFMATPAVSVPRLQHLAADRDMSTRVPWSIHAVLFASTSVIVGVLWDISWHRTIGRDTFWTPAHLAIYLGGVVAGLTCGYVALRTTFGGNASERDASVRFWGFRAPFGAWVCIWGAFAMLTSAPFDDWWHKAYGLDVKIVSPPHMLLAAGIAAIQGGAMLMALAWQNRAAGDRRQLGWLYLYGAGLLLLLVMTLCTEYQQRWDMHRSLFYEVTAGAVVLFLVGPARPSVWRWPATIIALVYSAVTMVMILVLPLFSAQPLLGPIFVQVDRFVPPDFPVLIIVPALCIDLLMQRARNKKGTL